MTEMSGNNLDKIMNDLKENPKGLGIKDDAERILEYARERGASDIHMTDYGKTKLRIKGKLEVVPDNFNCSAKDFIDNTKTEVSEMEMAKDKYASYQIVRDNCVYRVTMSTGVSPKGAPYMTAQARLLSKPLEMTKLQFSKDDLLKVAQAMNGRGIIIVAGDVASGKSTTCSSMIAKMIETRGGKYITLEDPVECMFEETNNSQVIQRTLGKNFDKFEEALVPVLRENPDVIYVGETRSTDTAIGVVQGAMTGSLVITTLHASSAEVAKERFESLLPEFYKGQFRENIKLTSWQRMDWSTGELQIQRSILC